jgi:DNA-binding NarL/FixJ family response regulator
MTSSGASNDAGPVALTVAIVDDHRLLVDALALAIESHGVRVVVPELAVLDVLADQLAEIRPDLVLLDLDLGPAGDGAELVRPLVEAGLRVLIVSASLDPERVARAVEQGATGVLRKDVPFSRLVETVLAAAGGHEVMAPLERLRLVDAARSCQDRRMAALAPFGQLTERECEVLRELTQGRAVAEIAKRSAVSEATVRSQVRSIHAKVGVRSQLEAVVAAHRTGWS